MQPEDLDFAARCTAVEGWVSEGYSSFQSFYQHDPAGCLVALVGDIPAGICVATPYGHCGFIGELIVLPKRRGQGIGAALLEHAIGYLHNRGAQTIYLDGVVLALPLYERHGFRKICRSLRFSGELPGQQHPSVRPMLVDDLPEIFELDYRTWGADRSYFLARRRELFPELAWVMVEGGRLTGYILGRCGEDWAAAGPWVVEKGVLQPQKLLESLACAAGRSSLSVGVLEKNTQAVEMVLGLGFVERFDSPWRMALGPGEDLGLSPQCIAVGSAAKG